VLASETFQTLCGQPLVDLGEHPLRDISGVLRVSRFPSPPCGEGLRVGVALNSHITPTRNLLQATPSQTSTSPQGGGWKMLRGLLWRRGPSCSRIEA
jgi:hypothetical protein